MTFAGKTLVTESLVAKVNKLKKVKEFYHLKYSRRFNGRRKQILFQKSHIVGNQRSFSHFSHGREKHMQYESHVVVDSTLKKSIIHKKNVPIINPI